MPVQFLRCYRTCFARAVSTCSFSSDLVKIDLRHVLVGQVDYVPIRHEAQGDVACHCSTCLCSFYASIALASLAPCRHAANRAIWPKSICAMSLTAKLTTRSTCLCSFYVSTALASLAPCRHVANRAIWPKSICAMSLTAKLTTFLFATRPKATWLVIVAHACAVFTLLSHLLRSRRVDM